MTWVAQTFLQLVLLSVIMVGPNVPATAADKRAEATLHDANAALHELAHVPGRLAAQDVLLTEVARSSGWSRYLSSTSRPTTRSSPGTDHVRR